MAYVDFLSTIHRSTKRDYLARVNDPEFPKTKAAALAKQWAFDYWDGDRRINYGGYRYDGRWARVAKAMADHYGLKGGHKILDVGCGKGFLVYDFTQVVSGADVRGIDISDYAIANAKDEVKDCVQVGTAASLPFTDKSFDLVVSINTLHNLHCYDLDKALREIERVGRNHKYICVEFIPKRGGEGEPAVLASNVRSVQYAGGMGMVVPQLRLYRRLFFHLFRVRRCR